jgi:chromosomal replication initiator protein
MGGGVRVEQAWDAVQNLIREKIGPQSYEIWIRPLQAVGAGPSEIHLEVPNKFYRGWVEENYGATLRSELGQVLGREVTLQYLLAARKDNHPSVEAAPESPAEAVAVEPIPGVSPDKTFENFVVGACNQFAHAASLAAVDAPGEAQYNPLFIYGSTGLGKTHLMHAIGNRARAQDPSCNVVYVTAERFTNDLIDALRYRRMAEFRDRYRNRPNILLIDDVQFLSGKDRTQEELFHTFEFLRERNRQIVFTADVLPREIRMFEPRLRTRCESGMLADTQPPDLETMLAILRQKAEDLDMRVPDDVAQWIGTRIRGNVRELEGALNRLHAQCRLLRATPDLDMARSILGSMLPEESHAVTPEEIIEAVASFFNVKSADIKGVRRLKQIVRPRHIAMFLIRRHVQLSYPEIGRVFGNRDHATVQHATKKMAAQLPRDADLRNTIQLLERTLVS